jgi:Zn-dependent protease with chaperone function
VIAAAALWLALCVGFAVAAPRLAAAARPDVAVRLTVSAAVALTATGVFVLGSAAATWAVQEPVIAALSRLSAGKLHATSPIPPAAAALAAVALVAAAGSLAVCGWRSIAAQHAVRAAVGGAGGKDGVIVLADPRIDAFATPGRRGRIVVTTGLLSTLDPAERAALLAHERAHCRHAHAWWRLAMQLTVAVNPLLRRVRRAADHAMERSADEAAAAQVGDRRLVARTVARVALLKKGGTASIGLALPASGGDVVARVQALLKPASPRGRVAAIALFVFLSGALVAAVLMQRTTDGLFDAAHIS